MVWLVLPGHLIFSILVSVGALQQGFDGSTLGAKAWGVLYVATSFGIAIAMELGGGARDSWYWMVPWSFLLIWGWAPAIAIAAGAWMAPIRLRRLNATSIRKRKRATNATGRGKVRPEEGEPGASHGAVDSSEAVVDD